MPYHHIAVMPTETMAYLDCRPGKIYVDGTVGGAGHTRLILERILPDGLLIGMDQDMDAVENARAVCKSHEANFRLVHGNFATLPAVLSEFGLPGVDGILLDLGVSLHQFEKSGRGFSFKHDEPLDMRMDVRAGTRAEDMINSFSEAALGDLFKTYGEEPMAYRLARKIVMARKHNPIRSSKRLADIVCEALPPKMRYGRKLHPATRVFMALRIAVNKELERLEEFISVVPGLLNPEGRICVLTFHSLEDRIVKQGFQRFSKACTCPPVWPKCQCQGKPLLRMITRKALKPSEQEIIANPMARSAKLRVAGKL